GEAVHRAPPARAHPLGRRREAARAERPRIEALRAALAAALEVELVARERLPVPARLLVDARERLPVRLRLRHHARPRIIVTPLCPPAQNAPPSPGAQKPSASSVASTVIVYES